MLRIPNSAEGNCLKEKENHTLCLKSDIKLIIPSDYVIVSITLSPKVGNDNYISLLCHCVPPQRKRLSSNQQKGNNTLK